VPCRERTTGTGNEGCTDTLSCCVWDSSIRAIRSLLPGRYPWNAPHQSIRVLFQLAWNFPLTRWSCRLPKIEKHKGPVKFGPDLRTGPRSSRAFSVHSFIVAFTKGWKPLSFGFQCSMDRLDAGRGRAFQENWQASFHFEHSAGISQLPGKSSNQTIG
jgi:hypothetical protein